MMNIFTNIPANHILYQNYPNPFNPSTVIEFYLSKPTKIDLSIYNILGQKVKSLGNGDYSQGRHLIKWDGTNDNSISVSAGIYIYRFVTPDFSLSRKMTLLDGGGTGLVSAASFRVNNISNNIMSSDAWTFSVSIEGAYIHSYQQSGINIDGDIELNFLVNRIASIPFAVQGDYIGINNGSSYTSIFIKGINLGVSVPGTQPGELAATTEQYQRWIQKMGEIGINSIRVYTLHFPRFYEVLREYNLSHSEKPIYLFQGIWLDEENPTNDLKDLTSEFDESIEEVIDCIHGNRVIENRIGKAYGTYTTDISDWIIGYILGREIFPDEVITTNINHSDNTSYTGSALSIHTGTPADVWATKRLDKTISFERMKYKSERPVSLSSWPTLDPITHPTEDSTRSNEDIASINLTDLDVINAPAGIFTSYHAYPYYPNFINEDLNYIQYTDNTGPNSYLGYLTELKEHYKNQPMIIAEYGVPSSWGNAHFSHSGMHHGGLDEQTQGDYNVRMLQNIYDSGCGGGMLFSWIDEWFKQAWITNPMGPDPSRRHLWHNVTNPEQNFGLISFDQEEPDYSQFTAVSGSGRIKEVRAATDNAFFNTQISLTTAITDSETLVIAYDTYRADLGESILPNKATTSNRAEFALIITGSEVAQLYVTQAYDLFGIWHDVSGAEQLYYSIPTDGDAWVPVRWKNGYRDSDVQNIGNLRIKTELDIATNLDAVIINENLINIKIPWTLLQFTDPSLLQVMHDNRSTEQRETGESDGIALTVSIGTDKIESGRFIWEKWDIIPNIIEREKESLEIFRLGLLTIPELIVNAKQKMFSNDSH